MTGKCFSLTGKCFPLTNFSNGKKTKESLESGFPKITFRETNSPLTTKITGTKPSFWIIKLMYSYKKIVLTVLNLLITFFFCQFQVCLITWPHYTFYKKIIFFVLFYINIFFIFLKNITFIRCCYIYIYILGMRLWLRDNFSLMKFLLCKRLQVKWKRTWHPCKNVAFLLLHSIG